MFPTTNMQQMQKNNFRSDSRYDVIDTKRMVSFFHFRSGNIAQE